jgi:pimeloyl-ACP methyl ester carboxylesterase
MAEDVHQLAEHLHLEHIYMVGHDIGGMVAYAFARRYPETSRGVMMLDAPLHCRARLDEFIQQPRVLEP